MELKFIKNGFTGVEIECRRGAEVEFKFLARDTEAPAMLVVKRFVAGFGFYVFIVCTLLTGCSASLDARPDLRAGPYLALLICNAWAAPPAIRTSLIGPYKLVYSILPQAGVRKPNLLLRASV